MADADGFFSRLCLLALCIFVEDEVEEMMQQRKPKSAMRSCFSRSRGKNLLNIASSNNDSNMSHSC